MATYYSLLTKLGKQAVAEAIAANTTVNITAMAVGDGGGKYYEPNADQLSLVGEKWRGAVNVRHDAQDTKRVIASSQIASEVGGFMIREAALFDDRGRMLVVAKEPLTEKVAPESGAAKDVSIRIYFDVDDQKAVAIAVDPSVMYALERDFLAWVAKTGEMFDIYTAALDSATRSIADHEMRIAMLEDALFNDLTTNSFTVRFDTLGGVVATGVYNEALQRLEC